jgi:ribosomal protein S12 methylthiotransferase accessory factor
VLLRGLQEVTERDAVVGAWWGRYPLEEWPAAEVLVSLGGLRERLERPNLRYRCFRVETPFSDHVTVVTLEGEDREGYCFSAGSACRETRVASWNKSVLEAVHGRPYVRYLKARYGPDGPRRPPDSFAEHAAFYSYRRDLLPRTAFAKGVPPRGREGAVEGLAALAERLGPDRPVLFRNLTPPGLASEGLDWLVLRVVVPGLQPLHGHHRFPHLGGPLWAPRGLAEYAAVPPHPFP